MAKIVNFLEAITDYTGAIPATITDSGEKIFDDGILDVIERFAIINPQMLDLFAAENSFIPDVGYSLSNIKILNVSANNSSDDIVCNRVSKRFKEKVQKNSGSLYQATLSSPVYYVINGMAYTAPQYDYSVKIASETINSSINSESGAIYIASGGAPAVGDVIKVTDTGDFTDRELYNSKGSEPAANDYFILTNVTSGSEAVAYIGESKISEVVKGTVTSYGSGTSSIANFPSNMYHLPVLYTAVQILNIKANALAADSDVSGIFTTIKTSIEKFASLITTMAASISAGDAILDAISWTDFSTAIAKVESIISTQSTDWDSFISNEDAEMAHAAIAGAQTRLGEASAQITKISEEIKQAVSYSAIAQGYGMQADSISKEIAGQIGFIQTKIASVTTDLSIYRSTAASLMNTYERFFMPYQQQDNGGKQ